MESLRENRCQPPNGWAKLAGVALASLNTQVQRPTCRVFAWERIHI